MLQVFDVVAGVLVLISALLATTRGATREILSLVSWAGAGVFAFWMWQEYPEFARGYIEEPLLADVVTVGASFLVALVILHLLTMRIADIVVDSKIGPLDRTLGFVFGAIRGVLILIVFLVFMQWLLPDVVESFIGNARITPTLERWADDLIDALPDDLESQITDFLQRGNGEETVQDAPALDQGTDALEQPLEPETNI